MSLMSLRTRLLEFENLVLRSVAFNVKIEDGTAFLAQLTALATEANVPELVTLTATFDRAIFDYSDLRTIAAALHTAGKEVASRKEDDTAVEMT